jgi:hypothetical protein
MGEEKLSLRFCGCSWARCFSFSFPFFLKGGGGGVGMKLRGGLSISGGETWKCVSEPRSMIFPFPSY